MLIPVECGGIISLFISININVRCKMIIYPIISNIRRGLAFFINFQLFFRVCKKRSKFSPNDIYIYLRLILKYGAKIPSQKKVVRVQS
jgi:hypothetical protein